MYVDDSIIFSLVIMAATLVFMFYFGHFAYRHIKEDIAKNAVENTDVDKG